MTRRFILLPFAVFAGLALVGLADLLGVLGKVREVWKYGP